MKKLLTFILSLLTFSFLFVPLTFASSGTISMPNAFSSHTVLDWTTGEYTTSPYLDPFHYSTCTRANNYLTGVLYNNSDNSIAASGMYSNIGCDGGMIFGNGNLVTNFQNNTPYYFIITDPNTGQTWQSPCFEDTGNDNQLVGCSGNNPPSIQPLSNTSVNQGGIYTANGSFTDPDSTSWTATVDYGDRSGSQSLTLSGTNFTLSHQYNTQGTYTVAVAVTDNQGATAGATALIAVAGSGTISIPSYYYARNTQYAGLVWAPNGYTASPYIDPFHYGSCARIYNFLTGVLYNESDNSVAASGMYTNLGCDGWMLLQSGNFGANFQNNTPYYFIITDPNTGQTWQSPCFEDTGTDSQLVACPSNQPPTVNPFSGATINEGDTYSASGSFTDPDSTSWTGTVDYGDGDGAKPLPLNPDKTFLLSHLYKDNQTNNAPYTVTVKITDNQGATSNPATAQVTVNNVAPTVNPITAPATPTQVNTPITASATFTDPGASDHHKAVWDWGDGVKTDPATLTENNDSGSVTDTHTYTTAGVYAITLTVTDTNPSDTTNTQGQQTFQYVVIYEPTSAKVDGSKEFNSPLGAYPQDPTATGKVNFGFRTFYVNNNLTGNARMSFKDISFATTAMDWVTVTGNKIQLQGIGSIVGQTDTYKIFISALDNANPGVNADTVRVKIWDTSTNNTVVYDSQPNADLTTDPTSVITKGDILIQ